MSLVVNSERQAMTTGDRGRYLARDRVAIGHWSGSYVLTVQKNASHDLLQFHSLDLISGQRKTPIRNCKRRLRLGACAPGGSLFGSPIVRAEKELKRLDWRDYWARQPSLLCFCLHFSSLLMTRSLRSPGLLGSARHRDWRLCGRVPARARASATRATSASIVSQISGPLQIPLLGGPPLLAAGRASLHKARRLPTRS